jgi:hypothetical protein
MNPKEKEREKRRAELKKGKEREVVRLLERRKRK